MEGERKHNKVAPLYRDSLPLLFSPRYLPAQPHVSATNGMLDRDQLEDTVRRESHNQNGIIQLVVFLVGEG